MIILTEVILPLKHRSTYKTQHTTTNIEQSPFMPISNKSRLLIIGIIILYLFVVGIVNLLHKETSLIFIYATFVAYIIALMFPIMINQNIWGWFHPLVFISLWTMIRTVLPSTLLYMNGLDYHKALPGYSMEELNHLVVYGIVLETIALIFIYFGYYLMPKIRFPIIQWKKPKNLIPKLIIVAVISTIALLVLSNAMGGIGNLLLQRGLTENMRASARLGGGHWNVIATLLIPACLVALAIKREVSQNPFYWLVFLYSLFLKFAESGSRSGVIVPIIMALMILMMQKKKIAYKRIITLGIIAVMIVGFLGEFRVSSRSASSLGDINLQMSLTEALASGFDTFTEYSGASKGIYPIIAKVPNEEELLYGQSYLAILAAPIPSAIWPNKPEAGGKLVSTVFFSNPLSGVPPGSVGEAFWNFHLIGVIFVFLVWGMFLKCLTHFYRVNANNESHLVLYVMTILLLAPNGTAYYDWLFMFVPALLFVLFFAGLPRILIPDK